MSCMPFRLFEGHATKVNDSLKWLGSRCVPSWLVMLQSDGLQVRWYFVLWSFICFLVYELMCDPTITLSQRLFRYSFVIFLLSSLSHAIKSTCHTCVYVWELILNIQQLPREISTVALCCTSDRPQFGPKRLFGPKGLVTLESWLEPKDTSGTLCEGSRVSPPKKRVLSRF